MGCVSLNNHGDTLVLKLSWAVFPVVIMIPLWRLYVIVGGVPINDFDAYWCLCFIVGGVLLNNCDNTCGRCPLNNRDDTLVFICYYGCCSPK